MDVLEKLLAPYKAAIEGTPSTDARLQADPLYSALFEAPSSPRGPIGASAPNASGLLELFYGGNRFNPSSVDPTHMGHLHVAMDDGIVRLGRKLQRLGFDVGENPAFGDVAPVHTENSYHYSGDALDVNYNGGGRFRNEDRALSWLEHWLAQNYG